MVMQIIYGLVRFPYATCVVQRRIDMFAGLGK